MKLTLERTFGASVAALLAGSATLVCCVLPAVMVSLGAGAALVGLITAIPQLVWLSEHKVAVFGVAGVLLIASGVMLRYAARLPCPIEPAAARACTRLRRATSVLFWCALIAYVIGLGFVSASYVVPGAAASSEDTVRLEMPATAGTVAEIAAPSARASLSA